MAEPIAELTVLDVSGCCASLGAEVLDEEAAATLAEAFKAVGDPVRLRLLSLLMTAAGGRGLRVRPGRAGRQEPADGLAPPQGAAPGAGLVTATRRGTNIWYAVVPGPGRGAARGCSPCRLDPTRQCLRRSCGACGAGELAGGRGPIYATVIASGPGRRDRAAVPARRGMPATRRHDPRLRSGRCRDHDRDDRALGLGPRRSPTRSATTSGVTPRTRHLAVHARRRGGARAPARRLGRRERGGGVWTMQSGIFAREHGQPGPAPRHAASATSDGASASPRRGRVWRDVRYEERRSATVGTA